MTDDSNSTSLRFQVAELGPGQCVSRSHRIKISGMKGNTLTETMDKMRLAIQPPVARASRQTGKKYAIEGGHWITRSGDLIVTLIISLKE